MCFNFFRKRKEESLKRAKKLKKEKVPTLKDIRSESKGLKEEEAKLKKIFVQLQKTKKDKSKRRKKK